MGNLLTWLHIVCLHPNFIHFKFSFKNFPLPLIDLLSCFFISFRQLITDPAFKPQVLASKYTISESYTSHYLIRIIDAWFMILVDFDLIFLVVSVVVMHFLDWPPCLRGSTQTKRWVQIPPCRSSPLWGPPLHGLPPAGCRSRPPAASTPSRRRTAWTEILLLQRTKPRRGAPSASQQETCLSLYFFYRCKSALSPSVFALHSTRQVRRVLPFALRTNQVHEMVQWK